MARNALIIANSISSQISVGAPKSQRVLRSAQQLKSLLMELPQEFAFATSYEANSKPERVEREANLAAKRCRGSNGLLIVYYFGHGRRDADDLSFVHPGTKPGNRSYLSFKALLYNIMAGNPGNVLFLLDCCYAGASQRAMDLLPEAAKKNCCLIACTSASTRAFWEGAEDNPIGTFTLALLDGLIRGTMSPTDDSITAASLFKHAHNQTKALTRGAQVPYIFGNLNVQISRYTHRPTIVRGISKNVSDKSAYCKIIATIKTLGHRTAQRLSELYERILVRHREAFLTNFIDKSRRIEQRPAKWTVLRRYVAFLRAIRAIEPDALRLTPRGAKLLVNMEELYNSRLQALLVEYLTRQNGLSVDLLRTSMQRVMERRWLPTRENVLNELFLEKGYDLNEQHLGLVLDLLGHIGAIGTLRKRQQVYFPWNETKRFPRYT